MPVPYVYVADGTEDKLDPLDIIISETEYKRKTLVRRENHKQNSYESALRYGKEKAMREFYDFYNREGLLPDIDISFMGNELGNTKFFYSFWIDGQDYFGEHIGTRQETKTKAIRSMLMLLNVEGVI